MLNKFFTLLNILFLPPTIIANFAFSAPTVPPETGASKKYAFDLIFFSILIAVFFLGRTHID